MDLVTHFQMLARYNRIANERLFGSCALLDDARPAERMRVSAWPRVPPIQQPEMRVYTRIVLDRPEPLSSLRLMLK